MLNIRLIMHYDLFLKLAFFSESLKNDVFVIYISLTLNFVIMLSYAQSKIL